MSFAHWLSRAGRLLKPSACLAASLVFAALVAPMGRTLQERSTLYAPIDGQEGRNETTRPSPVPA